MKSLRNAPEAFYFIKFTIFENTYTNKVFKNNKYIY